IGIGIGGAAEHDAIDMGQMRVRLSQRPDPAIEDDLEIGPALFQPEDAPAIERRHVTVLLGAKPLEPGFARMDDEGARPGLRHAVDEPVKAFPGVLVVDADAALYRDG